MISYNRLERMLRLQPLELSIVLLSWTKVEKPQSAVKIAHRGTKVILEMFLILLFILCQWQTA